MMPMVKSRRMLVVAASAIVAMQWLDPNADVHAAEERQSVSEKRAETYSAAERQGQVIQISAGLTQDIDRLEKRGTRANIYDLFSRRGQTSSAGDSPGQMSSAGRSPGQASSSGRSKNMTSGRGGRSSGQSARPPAEPAPVAAEAVEQPIPPPPIVAAPPPPPPAPKPPAVPFVYMGKLTETDRTLYFLVKGDKLYTVKPGEEIDGSYLFEGEVGNQIRLTYKPLHVAQTLTMMGP
jgi:hypothetical protein